MCLPAIESKQTAEINRLLSSKVTRTIVCDFASEVSNGNICLKLPATSAESQELSFNSPSIIILSIDLYIQMLFSSFLLCASEHIEKTENIIKKQCRIRVANLPKILFRMIFSMPILINTNKNFG